MKKFILLIAYITFSIGQLSAVAPVGPNWSVNAGDYQYDMRVVGIANIFCVDLTNSDNKVGAFVNGACRGVVNTDVISDGNNLAYLTIYSNISDGDTVKFKIYDSDQNIEYDVLDSVIFQSADVIGTSSQPYYFRNNNAPTSLTLNTQSIPENTAVSTVVGQLSTSDIDINDTHTFSFVKDANNADSAFFTISNTSLSLAKELDYNTQDTINVGLRVTDNNACYIEKSFIIVVTDINEKPHVNVATFQIGEQSPITTVVDTVTVTEVDQNQTHTFTLLTAQTPFIIDAASGEIKVNEALDFETTNTYQLSVEGVDNGTPALKDTATITINIIDENDAPSLIDTIYSIGELANNASIIGTVPFTETDANQTHNFEIITENSPFSITAAGQLSLSGSIDFETKKSHLVDIKVTDNGTPTLADTQSFSITVIDENEKPLIIEDVFELSELANLETFIGSITVTEIDTNQSHSFEIITPNTPFSIDAATGELSLTGSIDFETQATHVIDIKTTDNGSPALADTGSFTVNIIDINEAPVINIETFYVSELASIQSVVDTLTIDPVDLNQTHVFQIITPNSPFQINPSTGEITLTEILDFETQNNYEVAVTVTDNGTPVLSNTETITINVIDENEKPEIDSKSYEIAELSAMQTSIGMVTFNEIDAKQMHSFEIVTQNAPFTIDKTSGELSLTGPIDFETKNEYTLQIKVTDNGKPTLSDTGTFIINVLDENEKPEIDVITYQVGEHAEINAPIGSVTVTEIDTNQSHTFKALTATPFIIDAFSGEIKVNEVLDFETTNSYQLSIEVVDNGFPALKDTATITINIIDENDAPSLTATSYSIGELADNASIIGTVLVTETDAKQTHSFEILTENSPFSITTMGELSLLGAIDFETQNLYAIEIKVTDNGKPTLSDSSVFTINIIDENEKPEIVIEEFSIPELATLQTSIGIVSFTEIDTNQTHTFEILTQNTPFSINQTTGELSLTGSIDFETQATHIIDIKVADNGKPSLSDTESITINITDVNEKLKINVTAFNVSEFASLQSAIGTLTIDEVDQNQTHVFEIITPNMPFQINAATGEIILTGSIDFETQKYYDVAITVTDDGTPPLPNTETITINVTDMNEQPEINIEEYQIGELAATQTSVGIVTAEDVDENQSHTFELLTPNTPFEIDPTTGELKLTGAIDFEDQNEYSLPIKVTDNGTPTLSDTKIIRIKVLDENEKPKINVATYQIEENSTLGTEIGTVTVTEIDANQTHHFEVLTTNTPFAINPSNGALTVNGAIDFETKTSYEIDVKITDDATKALEDMATITINILDSNEKPKIDEASYEINELAPAGTEIGTVTVTEIDENQRHIFELITEDTPFSIEALTGELILEEDLNFENISSYQITVAATDDADNELSDTATFTITIKDDIEPDVLKVGNFVSPNGDGKNDYWRIPNVALYADFSLFIMDEYQQIVFEKNSDYNNEWDATLNGKSLPDGNYYYEFKNDNTGVSFKGIITVVK